MFIFDNLDYKEEQWTPDTHVSQKFLRGMLFDLDGVLVDSEGIYTDFWDIEGRKFGITVPDFAYVIKGNTLQRILTQYFDVKDHPAILADLRQQEREMVYELFDGVLEKLAELRRAGYGIAIVTSSNGVKMRNLFKALPDLAKAVDVALMEEDVERSKPDPQGYLRAASVLGCEPSDCVVFEDSLSGLSAGRASGSRVVAIATTNPRAVIEPLADITLDAVRDFSLQ